MGMSELFAQDRIDALLMGNGPTRWNRANLDVMDGLTVLLETFFEWRQFS